MEQAPPQDNQKKTVYNASYPAIFARNFLAGFSHALGAIVAYLMVVVLLYYLAITYLLPRIQNLLSTLPQLGAPGKSLPSQGTSGYSISPADFQRTLQELQGGGVIQPTPPPQK